MSDELTVTRLAELIAARSAARSRLQELALEAYECWRELEQRLREFDVASEACVAAATHESEARADLRA